MKDSVLIEKVKEIGADENAVRDLLLDLLKAGDVTTEQVFRVLGRPSKEWPNGLSFSKGSNVILVKPSFVSGVVAKYKRSCGNNQAFCY